jgi:DNA-binding XRE family transcriptional regulator
LNSKDYFLNRVISRGIFTLLFSYELVCKLAAKKGKAMTQRDMAGKLDIDVKTLRNWRKHKPELYKRVMLGFKVDEIIEEMKTNYENLKKLQDELDAK